MWNEIANDDQIIELKSIFGSFQDCCLCDFYISTGNYVDESGNMNFSNIVTASLLFQRKSKTDPVLELKFEGVGRFNFKPLPGNYNGVIYDVALKLENGLFYWADFGDWQISDIEKGENDSIWICGHKLFWRLRPELLGKIVRIDHK